MSTDMMQIDSTDTVQATLHSMREALANQDTASLKDQLKKIQDNSLSQAIVDELVPQLFEPDSTLPEALSLVGCLVSTDAPTYLKPISRAVKKEAKSRASGGKPMTVSPSFLSVMVSQLKGGDMEVSANATEALVDCSRALGPPLAQSALEQIAEGWTEAWGTTMAQNRTTASTVCVRCAAAVVDLVALDDACLELGNSTGGLSLLLQMLQYDQDPLLQMSILDLVERLATLLPMHRARAQWLASHQVLQPLFEMTGAAGDSGPDPINGGAALRVLSAICRLGHSDDNHLFAADAVLGFHRALGNFQDSGELDRLALIDAISSFASASSEALEMVLSDPEKRDAWLNLGVAQPKLKGVILNSVTMVIDAENNKSLALKLFAQLAAPKDSTELVMGLAKSPIPEARLGAYNLLRAVAQTDSGSQMLLAHMGFFDWLVSREGEPTKEGKEGKYAVVQAILNSPVKGLLAADIVKQLEKIVQQGAHYMPVLRPELMTD